MSLAHASNNDAETGKSFAEGEVAEAAQVVTDGDAGCNGASLGEQPHDAVIQTKAERREKVACRPPTGRIHTKALAHWHPYGHGQTKAYLDELAFRHDRRKIYGVARIPARVIESAVAKPPLTMRKIVDTMKPHRRFASIQSAPA